MKKTVSALLIILTLTLLLGSTVAHASFGTGIETLAEDTKIIKSGLIGRKMAFTDTDFKQGLCISDFDALTITELPSSTEGTLMLAGRRVSEGVKIKRKNIPALVFIPASKEVTEAKFKFTVDECAGGEDIEFIIRFSDRINYEPKINEEHTASLEVKTQREIGIHGKMCATDADSANLEFIVVSYPKSGMLTIVDKATGEYVYTPYDSYIGNDSFIYVARDEWGNFSKAQKVNITVSERMSEVVYRDMIDRPEYNAAVAVTAMGIMDGKLIGDGVYFTPEGNVSRAEFVCMAMKAANVRPLSAAKTTYFDDNVDIPAPLVSYVATAQRMGIISGKFEDGALVFKPNEAITKYEAASIISKLLDTEADDNRPVFNDITSVPAWARDDVYNMCSLGIFEYEGNTVNATVTVSRAECASYLYRMMSL